MDKNLKGSDIKFVTELDFQDWISPPNYKIFVYVTASFIIYYFF